MKTVWFMFFEWKFLCRIDKGAFQLEKVFCARANEWNKQGEFLFFHSLERRHLMPTLKGGYERYDRRIVNVHQSDRLAQ